MIVLDVGFNIMTTGRLAWSWTQILLVQIPCYSRGELVILAKLRQVCHHEQWFFVATCHLVFSALNPKVLLKVFIFRIVSVKASKNKSSQDM